MCFRFCCCCCCCCCKTLLCLLLTSILLMITVMVFVSPIFSRKDEDVIEFGSQNNTFPDNGYGGTSYQANELVDKLILVMKRSAIISPQLNNITVERKLDIQQGSLEGLNIRGLVSGMHRSGDAMLAAQTNRFFLAMPIALNNITIHGVHRRQTIVGSLQAKGIAQVDLVSTRFKVSLSAEGMHLDDFKITEIGRIHVKELHFLPGLNWIFSWLGESAINSQRAEFVAPLEDAGRRIFQKALSSVTEDIVSNVWKHERIETHAWLG